MSKNRQGETSVRWPCALCGLEFALRAPFLFLFSLIVLYHFCSGMCLISLVEADPI